MIKKYPFIRYVSIILKVIWYFQWTFLFVLIIISVLFVTKSTIIDLDKIKGFHVQFARIDIQQENISDKSEQQGEMYLSNGEGRLHIKDTQHKFIFYRLFSAFVDTLLYIFIIYLLNKIFISFKTEVFFTKKNGIYLNRIAYTILSIAILPDLISYFINLHIIKTLNIEGITFKARFDFDIRTIFLALLIFVIAKAFVRGSELKEDYDLTI